MIDSNKAVFLPIDDKILNLFKGYVLDGEPLLNVKETDVYSIEEYFEFSDSISKTEKIIQIIVIILLAPIFIIILLIAAIFKRFDQVEGRINYSLNIFFSFLFLNKKLKKTRRTKKKKYNDAVVEDVPEFLNHCKKNFTKVYLYSYHELTNDEKNKVENLTKLGLISSCQLISKLSDLIPFVRAERISLHNSLLVITDRKEKEEANLLGLKWNSLITIIGLKREVEYYLKAKSNAFFTNDCILFIEDKQDAFLNDYIQRNLFNINSRLAEKRMELLYYPDLKNKFDRLPKSILELLRYRLPVLYSLTDSELKETIQAIIKKIPPTDFYKIVLEELELPFFRRPCLLRNISGGFASTTNKFTYSHIEYNTEADLDKFFEWYINQVKIPDDSERVLYSVAASPSEYDADWYFGREIAKDSEALKLKIDEFRAEGKFGVLAEAIMYMLETIKDEKPEILKKVRPLIEKKRLLESKTVLSPILIDKHYNIFLPDFGNMEVKLHTLPKTVYLFFLRYPNGIRFKELYQHRIELLEIYNKITNKYDNQEIEKAINDLVDMTNPSINQKCARIREAFRKLMDESTAKYYYIDGLNGEPKKILLPRDLIDIRY